MGWRRSQEEESSEVATLGREALEKAAEIRDGERKKKLCTLGQTHGTKWYLRANTHTHTTQTFLG